MISSGPDEELEFCITGGEVSDIKAGLDLIKKTKFSKNRKWIAMDKGYSYYITIKLCYEKGLIAVVPPKKNCKNPWEYHRWIYAYRNEIERLFGRIKQLLAVNSSKHRGNMWHTGKRYGWEEVN